MKLFFFFKRESVVKKVYGKINGVFGVYIERVREL